MKHISAFNGAVTARLTNMGLNSKAVLCACNAWRGGIKGEEETKSTTKMVGKVSKKGDGRSLNVSDDVKLRAKKVGLCMPGMLVGISDELTKLTDSYGVSLTVAEFPAELEEWLLTTEAFKFKPVESPATPAIANPVSA